MRLRDVAVFVDHVGDAARVLILRGLGGAVREANLVIGVAEQREGEVELLRKGGVVLFGVEAGTENDDVLLRVLSGSVPEPFSLEGSTRCIGFRIKKEQCALALKIR